MSRGKGDGRGENREREKRRDATRLTPETVPGSHVRVDLTLTLTVGISNSSLGCGGDVGRESVGRKDTRELVDDEVSTSGLDGGEKIR